MKKVSGYLASDGTFFDNAPQARLYDSEQALRTVCDSHKIDPDRLISFTQTAETELMEVLNARVDYKASPAYKDHTDKEPRPAPAQ